MKMMNNCSRTSVSSPRIPRTTFPPVVPFCIWQGGYFILVTLVYTILLYYYIYIDIIKRNIKYLLCRYKEVFPKLVVTSVTSYFSARSTILHMAGRKNGPRIKRLVLDQKIKGEKCNE